MQRHRSGINEALATTKGQLDKLHSDIELTLEKISSREKFLNSQLEPLLVQYRALQVSDSQFHYVADALFTLTGVKLFYFVFN
jgi:estrogen-related receptor beta like 1